MIRQRGHALTRVGFRRGHVGGFSKQCLKAETFGLLNNVAKTICSQVVRSGGKSGRTGSSEEWGEVSEDRKW